MSEKIKVQKRNSFGKKLKTLRRENKLPANIYGKEFTSTAVELPLEDFINLYKKAGETSIVEITLDKSTIPALIHNVHLHPVTHMPLHADFMKVNLKEKITTNVPLEFTGEAVAVKDNKGTLMHSLNSLEVEALPTDLPEKIEVNVEPLAEVGDQITVGDLKVSSSVTIKAEPTDVVASIAELREEEPEPEVATPEGEEATEEASGEQQEAGEEPKEESVEDETPKNE